MALLFCDSFDWCVSADIPTKWSRAGTNIGIGSGTGRNGTNSLLPATAASGNVNYLQKTFIANPTIIVGFAFKMASLPASAATLCAFYEGATRHVNIQLNTSGQFVVQRAGTTLVTSASGITAGSFQYIEIKVKVHDTTGTVDVLVDGVNFATFTGDTRNVGAVGTIDTFFFLGETGSAAVNPVANIDDFYLLDTNGSTNNTYLGDIRVECKIPNGAGNYAQWTPSASTNVSNIDDATPDGDTTYNSSATAAQKDSFTIPAITPTTGTIYAVAVNLHARKDDAGARSIRALARLSGTDLTGATKAVTTSYVNYQEVFETKPGGGAWAVADANGAEYGYDEVA